MTLLTYDFETGPEGATLTTGNSGASQVTVNTGSAVFAAAMAGHLGFGAQFNYVASDAQCLGRWAANASSLTMSFGGWLTSPNVTPAAAFRLGTLRFATGVVCAVSWTVNNQIAITDTTGGTQILIVDPATLGTKYWVSLRVVVATATTGTFTCNVYNQYGQLVGTNSSSTYNLGTAAVSGGDFGVVSAVATSLVVGWDYLSFNDGATAEMLPPGWFSGPRAFTPLTGRMSPQNIARRVTLGDQTLSAPGVDALVTPATVAGIATADVVTLQAGATVSPAVVASTTAVGAVTVQAGETVAPPVVAGSTSVPAPVVSGTVLITPAMVAGTVTVGAPVLSTGETVTASVVNAVTSTAAATPQTSETVPAAVVAGTTTVPAITFRSDVLITPAVVDGTATVPAAALSTGETVSPPVVAAVASVPAPTVQASETVSPAVVAGTTTVGSTTFVTGVLVTPAVVAGSTTVGSITFISSVTITPPAVATTASVPAPAVNVGSVITPAVVNGVTAVGSPLLTQLVRYNFEGATAGSNLSTGNTGASLISAVGGSAIGTATAAHGNVAGSFTGTTSNVAVARFPALQSSGTMAANVYFQLPALPSAGGWVYALRHSASYGLRINVTSAGLVQVSDESATLTSTGVTISTGTWYRVEIRVVVGTTTGNGQYTVNLYSGDSSTPLNGSPITSSTANLGTTDITGADVGQVNVVSAFTVLIDDVAFNSNAIAEIGPPPPTPATVNGTTAVPAPLVKTGQTVLASTVAAVTDVATMTGSGSALTDPATANAVTAVPAPALNVGEMVPGPGTNALTVIDAPTIIAGSSATPAPATVAGTTTVGAPGVAGTVLVAPAVVNANATVPAPLVKQSQTVPASTVQVVTTTPAASAGSSRIATAAVVQATTTIPAATITAGTGAAPAPATVAGTTAVPTPVTSGGARVPAAVAPGAVFIPQPTIFQPLSTRRIRWSGAEADLSWASSRGTMDWGSSEPAISYSAEEAGS